MAVSFKPPPPPDVPLGSKPSVFHLYTGPAGHKLIPRRDLANGKPVDMGSGTPPKSHDARNDLPEPPNSIGLNSSFKPNRVIGREESTPRSHSSNGPPSYIIISSDSEDDGDAEDEADSDSDSDEELPTIEELRNLTSRSTGANDSRASAPSRPDDQNRGVVQERTIGSRELSQIDREFEPLGECGDDEEPECDNDNIPSLKDATQDLELVKVNSSATSGVPAREASLHSIDSDQQEDGSPCPESPRDEIQEESTNTIELSQDNSTQLDKEPARDHAIDSTMGSSNSRKRVLPSTETDPVETNAQQKRHRGAYNAANQDEDDSDVTSDDHHSRLQSPSPQPSVGHNTEGLRKCDNLGDANGRMEYPARKRYSTKPKARSARARRLADPKHYQRLLHQSSVKGRTRHPKLNKRLVEDDRASFISPLFSSHRNFQLRPVSSGLSFFAATIQSESSTLDPPRKELERLMKGALGYMVKIEDVSLQLLASGKVSMWLITGFTRNGDTSQHDSSSTQVLAASDMQMLHQQTIDATAEEIANTTDSDDSEDSGDQIMDGVAASAPDAAANDYDGDYNDGGGGIGSGNTRRRKRRKWTELEDEQVIAWNKENQTCEWMAKRLNERTPGAVRTRLFILKLLTKPRRRGHG